MTGERRLSLGEEVANAVTHGLGLIASLLGVPLLLGAAGAGHDLPLVIGTTVFAATLVALYAASTLYHALPHSRAKRVFRVVDHAAIYCLIAGTYTPFALGALHGPWGWSMLSVIWTLAAGGIVLKMGLGFRYPHLSTAIYLGMGWLMVVAVRPLALAVGAAGMTWIGVGGLSYTVGVYFYTRDHRRYHHFVWHLFVLTGSVCHLVAVARYANGAS